MAGHGVARHLTQHFFLPAETTLTPHNLLARLLVVAGSPFAGSDLQAAALLVLQSLHSRIHGAVGATWNSEIPLLLQYLQGKVLLGRGRGREGMASQLPSMAKGNPRLVPRACSAAVSFPCRGASTEAGGSGPTAIHSSRPWWHLHGPAGAVLVGRDGRLPLERVQPPASLGQASFAAALLLWLGPKQGFCLLSRRKGEHPRRCRVGAPSASGTAALGGVA